MATREQRTKLTLADIGEPSMVKTLPPDQKNFGLGRLVGIATGFVERQSADKTQTFEGLKGQFRVIPANAEMPELESGVMFIPDAFHNMIADKLRGEITKDPNASLQFGFDVSSIRANNPAGYSWSFKPLIESAAENPLDNLVKALPPPGKLAAIADQTGKAGKTATK